MEGLHTDRRQVNKMPSASDLCSTGNFASPLAQLSLAGSSYTSSAAPQTTPAASTPDVPPLNLNLFRTPSVYSVESFASLSTISADERAFNSDEEDETRSIPDIVGLDDEDDSPSTPRARDFTNGYFGAPAAPTTSAGPLTPKRSMSISRPKPAAEPAFNLRLPNKKVEPVHHDVEVHQPHTPQRPDDLESMYGEQGSEWGEDEANFEWVDTDNAPAAENGNGKQLSPSKRLGGKIRQVVGGSSHSHSEGRKLRKPLVFPRRAPPPPPTNAVPAPPLTHPIQTEKASPANPQRELSFPVPRGPQWPGLVQRLPDGTAPTASKDLQRPQKHKPPPLPLSNTHNPTMVPMRGGDGPSGSSSLLPPRDNRGSTTQSVAYSFYDLSEPGTPRPITPARTHSDSLFPHGKYAKISVSKLERETRERNSSDPGHPSHPSHRSPDLSSATPESLVAKGIEARAAGELPKSAWFFMKAADAGNATGRIYWGLALRHGWGVAKDEKKAFAELRQACDETLAQGGIDFHRMVGNENLTLQQKKSITRDLSLGMFEIANCFLEGVGVKRSPDIALSYLRFAGNLGDIAAQEQLGFLLSKGGSGVKKDMKEAAKWYRMAIGQGSTNTFGLAWIWKDKYM